MTACSAGSRLTLGAQQSKHGGSCREQCLFPLCNFDAAAPPLGASGKETQRYRTLVSEARWGLNYLHGEGYRARAQRSTRTTQLKAEALQGCTRQRICDLAWEACRSSSAMSSGDGLSRCLRGRSIYDASSRSSVASFVASRVALPSVAGVSPTLESLLPVQFQDLFKVDSEMLRPTVEVDSLNGAIGVPGFYHDPRLGPETRAYRAFVRKCLQRKFIGLTTDAKSMMGLFFVKKKNNTLRLIGDCRRTNRYFRSPPFN